MTNLIYELSALAKISHSACSPSAGKITSQTSPLSEQSFIANASQTFELAWFWIVLKVNSH